MPRLFRPVLLTAAVLVAVGAGAFHILARRLEQRIAERLEAESVRLGVRARTEDIRVSLWPSARLSNLTVEKPGVWRAHLDYASVTLRLWGRPGWDWVRHVSVGAVTMTLPAGVVLRVNPSVWDALPGPSIRLRDPTEGLTIRTASGPEGQHIDVEAARLAAGRLGRLVLEGQEVPDLGVVDGEAHVRRRSAGLELVWHLVGMGTETRGKATVAGASDESRLDLALEIARLDFAELLAALGLEPPHETGGLGSLSGTVGVIGPLAEPASLVVRDWLRFRPPPRLPPAVGRLRGDFTHEVVTPDGAKRTIEVAPASPDFIALADVPPLFVQTLFLGEDAAFYSHPGVDLGELPKALATNWARAAAARGGSTITQQLAKNLFLSREKSLHRKLRELALAFLLESALGKDRILEIYLNVIEWGPGLYGLRPAARHYFGKRPAALSVKETAFLVALIPGPVKYQRSFAEGALSPGFEPLVMNLLAKLRSVNGLTEDEYAAAVSETLAFRRPAEGP
jgi:penicillin-binding protein 1A